MTMRFTKRSEIGINYKSLYSYKTKLCTAELSYSSLMISYNFSSLEKQFAMCVRLS